MVGIILCFSVVAKMKIACAGGSSNVFKNALNALEESMCTSSITYTLYFPTCGGMRTVSTMLRMSSTLLFEAASNSKMVNANSSGVASSMLLMAFAKILAQEVLPTPRDPVKRYACAI